MLIKVRWIRSGESMNKFNTEEVTLQEGKGWDSRWWRRAMWLKEKREVMISWKGIVFIWILNLQLPVIRLDEKPLEKDGFIG